MNSDFHIRAMEWIRSKENFNTSVLPDDRLEERDGWERIDGFVVRGAAAGRWLLAGLWAELFGTMLVLANLPGFTPAIRSVTESAGYAGLVFGAVCFICAEVARRRQRTAAVLGLRGQAAGPVTSESLVAFQAAAGRASVWMMAEAGIAPEAVATAAERGVRCFIPDGQRFREVEARDGQAPADASTADAAAIASVLPASARSNAA